MHVDDLEARMRVFETAHDHHVLPHLYMVARLDGRGFTRLTKQEFEFEKPFDLRFRDLMAGTTQHLMELGMQVRYGYTQSDEISLLFDIAEDSFGRKLRKYNSLLAGEASGYFSLHLGKVVAFDCRISQLPRAEDVGDYFSWRQQDAGRNALSAHCYWQLREEGFSPTTATAQLDGLSSSAKQEFLFDRGINFNGLPTWQKRGIGFHWETYQKQGYNPKTKETVWASRKRLAMIDELPMREAYRSWVLSLMA